MNILLMTSHSGIEAYASPPIGLYRLKHHLNKLGIGCDILDLCLTGIDEALTKAESGRYQIIGISPSHQYMAEDLSLVWKFREAIKSERKCVFVAGGQQATYNYEQWLKGGIDICFFGYAERNLGEFAKNLNAGCDLSMLKEIDGIAYLDGDNIFFNPSKPMTKSEFEYFSYEQVMKLEVPYEKYWEMFRRDVRGLSFGTNVFIPETVRLYTSIGCPNHCGFCSSHRFLAFSSQKKACMVMLGAEQIYKLVIQYIDKYGAKGFLFTDSEFLANKGRALEFCEHIIKAKKERIINQSVVFHCQARVVDFLSGRGESRKVDCEFIDKLAEAGFFSVGLGIETFNDRLLRCPSINKMGFTEEDSLKVLDCMLERGLIPIVFTIIVIPETTAEEVIHTMMQTVNLVKKGCQCSVTPLLNALPGAPIYGDSNYPAMTKTFKHPMTREDIEITTAFIPKDPKIADCASRVSDMIKEEIQAFKNSGVWKYQNIPKTLAGILMFVAIAKLLGRNDLAKEWSGLIHFLVEL